MSDSNKTILKQAFQQIFESKEFDETVIQRFFSPHYTQWVDGHELDYQGLCDHLTAQKKKVETVTIHFEHLIEDGNQVATIHHVEAKTKDGHEVKGRVHAVFTFKNGQILACEELTYMTKARDEDKNLGSIT